MGTSGTLLLFSMIGSPNFIRPASPYIIATLTVTRAAAEPTPSSPPDAPDAPTGVLPGAVMAR